MILRAAPGVAIVSLITQVAALHGLAVADAVAPSDVRAIHVAAAGSDATCVTCHRLPADASHPVGVVPSMPIPPAYPLDAAGRTTCLTCHVLPGTGDAVMSSYLRGGPRGTQTCGDCHTGITARTFHTASLDTAHAGPRYREHAGVAIAGIDVESLSCLGCHDGANAPSGESQLHRGNSEIVEAAGLHPIGVDYRAATVRDRALVPEATLHESVRLYGGTVGCGSCHSPFSSRPHQLVIDNAGSALCRQCHRI